MTRPGPEPVDAGSQGPTLDPPAADVATGLDATDANRASSDDAPTDTERTAVDGDDATDDVQDGLSALDDADDDDNLAGAASQGGVPVAVVAKRLGIAPATLRTWDRRYGLGPSVRTAGAHRRYTEADIARLEIMRRLTLDSVAPMDAARMALDAEIPSDDDVAPGVDDGGDNEPPSPRPFLRAIPGGAGADATRVASSGSSRTAAADADRAAAERAGGPSGIGAAAGAATRRAAERSGGVVRPDVQTSTRVAAIVDTALAYDQLACNKLLTLSLGDDPVEWWTRIVEPAWTRIAERTVLGTPGEAPELVLASAALGALRSFTREYELSQVAVGNPPVNHPSRMRKLVLIFAPIDEDIPLAAHALAAALVSAGATARVVTGPASPHRAVELVTMVRPAALVLATSLARPDLGIVGAVHEAFPDLPMLVSLQRDDALPDLPLAPSVQRVRSFAGLVHEVLAVVGN